MGYQDAIASLGIHTTADNKPSNGTVDGVDSFDTKVYPTVDPATMPQISAPDESAKYAGNVAAWSDTDAYGNRNLAQDVVNFFNKMWGDRSGLDRKVFATNEGSRLNLIG